VGFFTADKWEHVCPTIRVEAPLRKTGIEVLRGNEWIGDNLVIKDNIIEEVDLVIIQRDFPGYYNEYCRVFEKAKKLGKPVVYEIDDLLLDLPEFHPDLSRYKPIRYRILEAIINSDAIICSNIVLRTYIQQFSENIYVLPNYIIPEIWDVRFSSKIKKNEYPVKITFMGSASHLADLEMIQPVLYKISQKYASKVEFAFWGCKPPGALEKARNSIYLDIALPDYKSFAKWFLSQTSDLFIAPLVDCDFNRSKSSLKYLECSILGVPGVYSNLPPYSCITNGVNGFLASSLDEWEHCLRELIENPILRYEIGTNALNFVRENYILTEERAQAWKNTLDKVLQKRKNYRHEKKYSEVINLAEYWYKKDEELLRIERERNIEYVKIIESKDIAIRDKESQIQSIKSSITWRILEKLSILRYRLFPEGSIFDKFLSKTKNYLLKRKRNRVSSIKKEENLSFQIIPNTKGGENLITILIPIKNKNPLPNLEEVKEWLSKQTVTADIGLWNQKNATLECFGVENYVIENIHSWKDVQKSIKTKYVVIGYFDLFSMPPTFLETNLIALESENLHYTINQLGYTNLFSEKLAKGLFPGSSELPCFRMVFNKDVIEEIKNIPSQIFSSTFQGVGKLIVQPVNIPDTEADVPFDVIASNSSFHYDSIKKYIFMGGNNFESFKNVRDQSIVYISSSSKKIEKPVVLMVHPFLAVGGVERVTLDLMSMLVNDFVFVIATHEVHKTELGTTIDEFRQITPFIYTFPDFIERNRYFEVVDYLIKKFQVNILYIANGSIWIYDNLIAISKKYPNIKIVNQVYDHEAGWINWYSKEIVGVVNAHIAINQKIIKAYKEKGVPSNSIYYIENGVNTDFYNPDFYNIEKLNEIKTRLGVPGNLKVVTFIGRIHPQKRPLDFVELSRRANLKGLNYYFLMVGDGVLSESVDREIITKGLKNIHHRTFYSPSRDIFAISDVIVLTSEYEGMPMVVLESLSMGVPVVSTDVGNVKDVLLATGGGIAEAEPGQIDKLLEGLQEVLDNPPNKEKIRERVKQNYSVKIMAEKYKKAFLGER
jgi:glycosyltransferase involved in cell wall biosynthesis